MHRQNLSKVSAASFPEDASPHGVRGEAKGNEGREKTNSVMCFITKGNRSLHCMEGRREGNTWSAWLSPASASYRSRLTPGGAHSPRTFR